jgi:hypothetical protein
MKVKISYTIDFEEIPTKVTSLAKESISNLEESIRFIDEALENIDNENAYKAIDLIGKFRESMMKCDMQMADCATLIGNYEKTKIEMKLADENPTEDDHEGG